MTQQRDDIVGRLEELVSSGRKLEPVAGSLLTIHLDMLEEAAAEITRLRAENAEAEQRGARAGLAAALNALKTAQYDPAPYTKGKYAIQSIDPTKLEGLEHG